MSGYAGAMRTAALLASVCLGLALSACGSDPAPPGQARAVAPAEAAALLTDRNWLDVWPADKDSRLHVFRFVPSMGGGVYHDRTVFQGQFELFTFDASGATIDFHFPHRGKRLRTGYKIERVDGPHPFDLRLTLDRSPRGPRVLYGIAAETGDAAFLDARLAAAAE